MSELTQPAPLRNVLTDVSVREGSQQFPDFRCLPVAQKIEFMRHTLRIGVQRVELTAFAPGEWFHDADKLVQAATDIPEDVELRALYFNTRGLERLLHYPHVSPEGIFHTAASTNYRLKNYRQKSVMDVVRKLDRLLVHFDRHQLRFDTVQMSTAWGEADEPVMPDAVLNLLSCISDHAARRGFPVASISLADTVGNATPNGILALIELIKREWPDCIVRAHLHPAYGMEEECVQAALDGGVDEWEASWGGLGGSPFAEDPGGNLDIRWLVRVYMGRGLEHGFDLEAIERAMRYLADIVERDVPEVHI
jgi:hydroxymethylglutaryl-CoA lyase